MTWRLTSLYGDCVGEINKKPIMQNTNIVYNKQDSKICVSLEVSWTHMHPFDCLVWFDYSYTLGFCTFLGYIFWNLTFSRCQSDFKVLLFTEQMKSYIGLTYARLKANKWTYPIFWTKCVSLNPQLFCILTNFLPVKLSDDDREKKKMFRSWILTVVSLSSTLTVKTLVPLAVVLLMVVSYGSLRNSGGLRFLATATVMVAVLVAALLGLPRSRQVMTSWGWDEMRLD